MITIVIPKDYYGIINTFTEEEIKLKYGKLTTKKDKPTIEIFISRVIKPFGSYNYGDMLELYLEKYLELRKKHLIKLKGKIVEVI